MGELEELKKRLSKGARAVINEAVEESRRRQHYYLGVEHIFLAFARVEERFFREMMEDLSLDAFHVINFLNEHLSVTRQYIGVGLKIPPATRNIFRLAWEEAQRRGRDEMESTDLLIAIFQENHSLPPRIFRSFGLDPDFVLRRLSVKVRAMEERATEANRRYDLPQHIRNFATNLNRLAAMDRLAPLVGREAETKRVIEILCHVERSNSVMLIGEPGVGKTAVAEGLARMIELTPELVPARLREKQVLNLQMNSIVAGTVFRGMFEDRVEKIMKELREGRNYILFIDEAHSLIGAGSAMGVPSDAANIFKGALTRGELQIIGATTLTEYRQFIAEDEAFARRFRTVHIKEPDADEARRILDGVRPRLERNYSVTIEGAALDAAMEMSARYMHASRLPDKPIGWLDTAAVKVEIREPGGVVTARDVMDVISQESGIPRDMIERDTRERLSGMESALSRRVVGQGEAVEAVARRLRLNKGPLKENYGRPDGVLLFLGPTGVGKTELAKALCEFLFGDERRMIRIDMSEYRDGGLSVDKLIGMPRGIVGSERGGILTNQVRDEPYSVILLDEMEKAHPFVQNLFLQVFDEGWLTDGRGRKVYFSDSVIIMTSNLGADEFKRFTKPMGYLRDGLDANGLKKGVMAELERTFSPEFLNRIDETVVFSPLSEDDVRAIACIHLNALRARMAAGGRDLSVTPEAIGRLAAIGFSPAYGARFLKRRIDDLVKMPITLAWNEGAAFHVDLDERGDVAVTMEERPCVPQPA